MRKPLPLWYATTSYALSYPGHEMDVPTKLVPSCFGGSADTALFSSRGRRYHRSMVHSGCTTPS